MFSLGEIVAMNNEAVRKYRNENATNNYQVAAAFARRERASVAHLVSDGEKLLSYGWYEIARWSGDEVIVRTGELYSRTTKAHHMRALIKALPFRAVWSYSTIETPWKDAAMKVPERGNDASGE